MGRPKSAASDEFNSQALFQSTTDPVFILNRDRRIRFVNPAFEQLAKAKSQDLVGKLCTDRQTAAEFGPLRKTLSPPPEVLSGNSAIVRRPAPPSRVGPPWWEIAFTPLAHEQTLYAVLGKVAVFGAALPRSARSLPEVLSDLRRTMVSAYSLAQFESEVPACAHVLSQIRLATQHRDPVLIFGETGTGKRTAARVIHQSSSQAERSMLRISAAALPESALRDLVDLTSDHRFGTISLEDPASLPRDLQQQLHQQLSAGNSHSRWITLNQRPLEVEVAAGRMISDLCYSLGVQSIRLLPLRERIDDLARLALSLVRRWPEMSQLVPQFSDAAMVLLRAHSWPGNLRELEEVLKAALTASEGKVVQVEHLPVKLRRSSEELPVSKPQSWRLDQLLESVERRMIQLALTKSKGNKTVAAELLGIWRPRFLRRMDALGIAAETQSDFQENDDDAPSTDRGA